jgi:hypothetical protein
MGWFGQLLLLVGAGLLIWYMIRTIRSQPEVFSKQMFSKSFFTMGILAVVLILFIAICIAILRMS